MKTLHTAPRLLCLAIAAAFPFAAAADDDIDRLVKPESAVTLGVGTVSTDNQRFGVYNGMAESGTHLIGDASIRRRYNDDTWFRVEARNLGLPTRELRLEHEKQGNWGYSLEYSEIPRVAPYDVHTNLSGVGGANLVLPTVGNTLQAPSANGETTIKTERQRTTFGFMKYLNPRIEFALNFRNEEKRGERLFGRGTPSVQEFLAEPIDTTTRQLDMTLAYLGEKFQLTGGYYGSFFQNDNTALNVSGGSTALGTTASSRILALGLPPDNQAHQLYLTGGYDFSRSTRATFKYAQTRATQTDTFMADPFLANISGRTNLGGRLDTTLLQAGVTSRPTHQLSLLANLRYEDRDDNTAVAQYLPSGGSTDGRNERRSLKTLNGKLEASYQLGAYRLTGGVDYEDKDRSMAGVRVVGYRAETRETTYRAEVKRALSDSISGTAAFIVSNRDGSDYRTLRQLNGTLYNGGGWLQPVYIADRDRQKFKLLADWSPVDALSVQFALEDARDEYADRDQQPRNFGVRDGDSQLYSLDASYAINDNWRVNAYAAHFATRIAQATGSNATTSYWTAALQSVSTNFGLGLKGKLTGRIDVGADLLWAEDNNDYKLGGAATSLPDIDWLQTTFKLYGSYAYDKDTRIRVDYVHDRRKTNDWTWNAYRYSDGTWLYQEPLEKVHFLGVSLQHSFR